MIKLILAVNLILLVCLLNAQSAQLQWAGRIGGISNEESNAITVDVVGNVYTTGYFYGTVDFNPGPGSFTLTSVGLSDIFICKLDASGNFLWARQFGGTGLDIGFSITTDKTGNVYIAGSFIGTGDFDPGAGITNLTSAGLNDVFIVKLDSSGNFSWAKQMGGPASEQGQAITIDASGNICIAGWFQSTADFDPSVNTYNLTSVGAYDIFVSKLDPSGTFIWAKQMGGTVNDLGYGIATDAFGNIYTTGYYSGTADFDPGTGTYNLSASGTTDIFIVKLNTSGNFIWAKSMGGTSYSYAYSIAVDALGNVLTSGFIKGVADFNPGTGIYNLATNGYSDVFISELDSSGNFVWAKSIGGAAYDESHAMVLDRLGNIYITGKFQGTVDFNPDSLVTENIIANGGYDIFILKLNPSGKYLWAKKMGAATDEVGSAITVNNAGIVYSTGYFNGTVDFDPDAGITNLVSAGGIDIYMHKLSQSGFGLTSKTGSNNIKIYPNPTTGITRLLSEGSKHNRSLEVYNSIGELVQSDKIEDLSQVIDLSKLASGLFYVKIFDNQNNVCVEKLIKTD